MACPLKRDISPLTWDYDAASDQHQLITDETVAIEDATQPQEWRQRISDLRLYYNTYALRYTDGPDA